MCKSVEAEDPAWEGWEHWYFGQEEEALDAPPAPARAAFEPHRERHHVEASAGVVSGAVWH